MNEYATFSVRGLLVAIVHRLDRLVELNTALKKLAEEEVRLLGLILKRIEDSDG